MTPRHRPELISLFGAYAVAGFFWGAFAAAAPEFQARAELDAGGFGLALGVMPLAAFPVMRIFGRVATRLGAWAIPSTMIAFGLGIVALGLAEGRWAFVAALMLVGGGSGALDIALNLRTAAVEERSGLALFNRTHAVFPFAMLGASAATGLLREEGVSAATIFPVLGLLCALSAAAELWAAGRASGERREAEAREAQRLRLGRLALILGAIAALGAFQEAAAQAWAAIFVEVARGGSPAGAGLAAAAFTLGLGLGRLIAHALDRALRPRAAVRLAAGIGAAGFLALTLAGPPALTVILFLLAGIGVGPIEPAVYRAVARRTEAETRARTLAAVTAIAYLGYLLSPPALGLVADAAGYPALWAASALAAAIVAALTFALPRAT